METVANSVWPDSPCADAVALQAAVLAQLARVLVTFNGKTCGAGGPFGAGGVFFVVGRIVSSQSRRRWACADTCRALRRPPPLQ